MNNKLAARLSANNLPQFIRIALHCLTMVFLMMFFTACQPHKKAVDEEEFVLTFQPFYKAQAIKCSSDGMIFKDQNQHAWQVQTLAFYVSEIDLQFSNNPTWVAVPMAENQWQSGGTGLLWFNTQCQQPNETTEATQNSNKDIVSNASNHLLHLKMPSRFANDLASQEISAIRFSMSVPFAQNHQNPLIQASPLNVAEMFWSWRLGHKFFRLDLIPPSSSSVGNSWSFHLGSLGCESSSSIRPPTGKCLTPNRFSFEVALKKAPFSKANEAFIQFDLSQVLEGINLMDASSCMFSTGEEEQVCRALITNVKNKQLFRSEQK